MAQGLRWSGKSSAVVALPEGSVSEGALTKMCGRGARGGWGGEGVGAQVGEGVAPEGVCWCMGSSRRPGVPHAWSRVSKGKRGHMKLEEGGGWRAEQGGSGSQLLTG